MIPISNSTGVMGEMVSAPMQAGKSGSRPDPAKSKARPWRRRHGKKAQSPAMEYRTSDAAPYACRPARGGAFPGMPGVRAPRGEPE